MPAASSRRDLFISVNGSIDGLSSALKAGRSTLLDFDQAAGSIVDQVSKKLREMGAGSATGADEAVKNYSRAFKQIESDMRAAASNPASALKIFDVASMDAQIAKAEQAAAVNRTIAETAQQVASAGGANASVQLQIAAAYGTAAAKGEQEVIALRSQRDALGEVRAAMGTNIVQTDGVTHATSRMSIAKMEMMHVVRSSTDAFAAGAPVTQIFSMEIGRLAEAAALSGGSMGKLGAVLGGPWGMAITAGLAVLAPFVAKLFESGDSAGKAADKLHENAEQTRESAAAQRIYDQTLDGVIAKEEKLIETLERRLMTQREINAAQVEDANIGVDDAQKAYNAAKAVYDQAYKTQRSDRDNPGYNGDVQARSQMLADDQKDVEKANDDLSKATAALATARRAAADAEAAQERDRATELAQKGGAQRVALEDQRRLAEIKYSGSGQSAADLAELRAVELRVAKALSALGQAKADPAGSPQSALLATAEGYRGAAEGSSSLASLFSRAGINIDPKITAWCAAFVNAVLATDGLHGTGSLSAKSFLSYGSATNSPQKGDIVVASREGGGHVGFFEGFDKAGNVRVLGGNTGNKVGVETIARANVLGYRRAPASQQAEETATETAAQKKDRLDKAFGDQIARAQDEQLKLQQGLSRGTDEELGVQLDRIAKKKEQLDHDVDIELKLGQIPGDTDKERQANADKLKLLYRDNAILEGIAATRADMSRKIKAQLATEEDQSRNEIAMLDLQIDLAHTVKERRELEQRKLAREYQTQRDVLSATINDPSKSQEEKDRAASARDGLDARYPLEQQRLGKQTAGPLDQYRDQLHRATDDMNSALEGVATHGMQTLENELLNVIDGTESLGAAFKKVAASIIADLARIAIEKAIVQGLNSVLGGGSVSAPDISSIPFVGYQPHATGFVPGFAAGVISGPGTGTSDSIFGWMEGRGPIRVSNGESIMTAEATRRFGPMLRAMNDNSLPRFAAGMVPSLPSTQSIYGGHQRVTVDNRVHIEPSPLFDVKMTQRAAEVVGSAAQPIMDGAESQTMRRAMRPALPGGFG